MMAGLSPLQRLHHGRLAHALEQEALLNLAFSSSV